MTKNKAIRTALRRLGIERGAIPIFLPMLIQLKKYLPLLGGLLCLPTAGFAQFPSRFVRAEEPGNLAISVGGGIANYRGDLNEGPAKLVWPLPLAFITDSVTTSRVGAKFNSYACQDRNGTPPMRRTTCRFAVPTPNSPQAYCWNCCLPHRGPWSTPIWPWVLV